MALHPISPGSHWGVYQVMLAQSEEWPYFETSPVVKEILKTDLDDRLN
jgi:hypothetical protein